MSGSFSVSKYLWKISTRTGAKSLCKVCRTMGLNLSGPADLCGFKPTSSLSMPSAVMHISGILGWVEGLRAVEEILKPAGSLLATDRSKAVVLV